MKWRYLGEYQFRFVTIIALLVFLFSSYLSDVQGSLTTDGDSTRNTRPIMCNRFVN
jgi:hypothetical protein